MLILEKNTLIGAPHEGFTSGGAPWLSLRWEHYRKTGPLCQPAPGTTKLADTGFSNSRRAQEHFLQHGGSEALLRALFDLKKRKSTTGVIDEKLKQQI